MDADDLRAALEICLTDPSRHFNVTCICREARQIGEDRRTVKAPTR